MRKALLLLFVCFLSLPCAMAQGQTQPKTPANDQGELLKATQNPVADLISVPFQNNTNLPIGSFSRTQNILNIQPVVPFGISEDWNIITRTILPIVSQPDLGAPTGFTNGLGDLNPTIFLSPKHPGKLIWGVGPAFVFPTATDDVLGTGKWSVGPSFVALVQPTGWTIGVITSNVWSFAGDSDRLDVNAFDLQYFINRNFKKGWYLTSAPILTADWELPSDERWIVPFGLGIGRIFKIGKRPVNAQISGYYNVIHPDTLPYAKWQIRSEFTLLFPEKKK